MGVGCEGFRARVCVVLGELRWAVVEKRCGFREVVVVLYGVCSGMHGALVRM